VLDCADADDERAREDRVPLALVDLDPDARDRLLALGITTVGGFLRLPAGGIRARFGAAADGLYRLAAGHRWAPLVPVPPEEPHCSTVDFDFPESHVDRLIFVVKRMLDGLAAEIDRQVRAITAIVLRMTLDNRESRTEQVRPAAPTLDVPQLLALIRLRLDALQLPGGIVALALTADTCAADANQRRLFPEHSRRATDAAGHAFARLRAEFGEHSVVRARLCDAHLPGARFVWEPLEAVPQRSSPRVISRRPLVRRILATPKALSMPRAPALSMPRAPEALPMPGASPRAESREPRAGPYLLSGGWWGTHPVEREYYFVRAPDGEMCWIYYDRRRERFFLQGYVE
jgi:protein ImuB